MSRRVPTSLRIEGGHHRAASRRNASTKTNGGSPSGIRIVNFPVSSCQNASATSALSSSPVPTPALERHAIANDVARPDERIRLTVNDHTHLYSSSERHRDPPR